MPASPAVADTTFVFVAVDCSNAISSAAMTAMGVTLSTEQVCTVMDRIAREAHVPSLSFTGGEATLRKDLPALVKHGSELGLRVNLITNGSIEAQDAALHDHIVGRKG